MAEHHLSHLTDRELLQRFTKQREEAAFLALLKRHGTVIQRICRRTLPNAHDADDVFQATFLVLLKKASTLRWRDSIAGWLHEVAYRLAANKKRAGTWRGIKESQAAADDSFDPLNALTVNEAQTILHEELNQLPEALRGPLVLCYLENATQEEAARQLGWSLRTLKRRLQRGRDLLHKRLTRRGLTLSAVLSTGLLAPSPASAALIRSTLAAAVSFTSGKAGTIAAPVAVLVQGALGSMFLTKVKVMATLAVCLVASGLVFTQVFPNAWQKAWPGMKYAEAPEISKSFSRIQKARRNEEPSQVITDEAENEKDEKNNAEKLVNPLPPGALARLGNRFQHGGSIFAMAYSPDGKTIATGSGDSDSTLRIWDSDTGRELRRLLRPGQIYSVAFSPDGKTIACVGAGSCVPYGTSPPAKKSANLV